MFGKLAFFFILALCATQGQTRSVQDQRFDEKDTVSDIINGIIKMVNKIQKIISEIANKLPGYLEELKNMIDNIVNNLDLSDIVKKITKTIEDIVGVISEKAKECIEAESDAIEKLAEAEQDGIKACVGTAETNIQYLEDHVKSLVKRGNEIRDDVIRRIEQCKGEEPIKVIPCLMSQIAPIAGEMQQIEKEVVALTKKATNAVKDFNNCMTDLQKQTNHQASVIAEQIKECIKP